MEKDIKVDFREEDSSGPERSFHNDKVIMKNAPRVHNPKPLSN